MKGVICFLALVAFVNASKIATYSIASGLKDILESIRDDMPCGFPILGLGPLAPLFVSEANVSVDLPSLQVLAAVQNFTVNNLNGFEVLKMNHNIIKRKLTFSLLFENIEVNTWYDLKSDFQESGWTVKLDGSGNAYFAVKGLLISVTAKYSISLVGSRIKLKDLKIVPHVDSVASNIEGILGDGQLNAKGNSELEKVVPAFVNSFGESIADKLEAIILPVINSFLNQHSLNGLLGGIAGNSIEGEKIKCQPAEQGVLSS